MHDPFGQRAVFVRAGIVEREDLIVSGATEEVIGHIGPRPKADLKTLFAAEGLI